MYLSRRRAILGAWSAPFALIPVQASAQYGPRDEKAILLFAEAENMADELLDAAVGAVPATDVDIVAQAATVDELARSAIDAARGGNDDLLAYVRPTEFSLAQAILRNDLPLLPVEREPHDPELQTPESPSESLDDIVLDILWHSVLGGDFAKYLGFKAAWNELGLNRLFALLKDAVRNKNWAVAARLVRRIMAILVDDNSLLVLEGHLGRDVVRGLLRRVSARFVPFIGWALLVVDFIEAVQANWDRIQKTL